MMIVQKCRLSWYLIFTKHIITITSVPLSSHTSDGAAIRDPVSGHTLIQPRSGCVGLLHVGDRPGDHRLVREGTS